MALYLGSEEVKLYLGTESRYLNLFSEVPIMNGVMMSTLDNCILKDSNGLFLTAKEDK